MVIVLKIKMRKKETQMENQKFERKRILFPIEILRLSFHLNSVLVYQNRSFRFGFNRDEKFSNKNKIGMVEQTVFPYLGYPKYLLREL